uniref:Uncharacterized protein n=1 Tax=Arundo donax TaxID=35708 RepID=A0A0A9H0S0_ARUDO
MRFAGVGLLINNKSSLHSQILIPSVTLCCLSEQDFICYTYGLQLIASILLEVMGHHMYHPLKRNT